MKGRALDVYDRLSVDDAADYEKLKEELLKNFDMTDLERSFAMRDRKSQKHLSSLAVD